MALAIRQCDAEDSRGVDPEEFDRFPRFGVPRRVRLGTGLYVLVVGVPLTIVYLFVAIMVVGAFSASDWMERNPERGYESFCVAAGAAAATAYYFRRWLVRHRLGMLAGCAIPLLGSIWLLMAIGSVVGGGWLLLAILVLVLGSALGAGRAWLARHAAPAASGPS